MDIKEFLKNKFRSSHMTKSDTGDLVTFEEKQRQDIKKAQAQKLEEENKKNKVNQDIHEALAFLNSPRPHTRRVQTKTINTNSVSNIDTTTSNHSSLASNIDIPLTQESSKTLEDAEMRKYVLESAKLLKSSPVKHQNKKPNVEVLNKNKKNFDIDR